MHRSATLVQSRLLSPSVASLMLAVDPGPLSFVAGQWINLYVPNDDEPIKRAYSIASGPADGTLELAVTRVEGGAASPTLHGLKVGDELAFDGPHGLFTRDAAAQAEPALFVATGTGLSPFRSMLRHRLLHGPHAPVTLLFGARSQADILWREELEELARQDPRFRLEVTLSRPELGWSGRTGHVQAHLVELVRESASPPVYICGLTKMVSDVRAMLKGELDYDRKRVHSERYD